MSLTSPLATIASLFDAAVSANGGNLPSDSDDWGVAAVFLPVLQSSSDKVPILCKSSLESGSLPPGCLVRWVGMVQDMLEVEFYPSAVVETSPTGSSKLVSCKYKDGHVASSGCSVSNLEELSMGERAPLYCVPLPGMTPWAKRLAYADVAASLRAAGLASPSKSKRDRDSERDEGDAETPSAKTGEGGVDPESVAVSASFPLQEEADIPCIVYLYGSGTGGLKLSDAVEFFGVLSEDTSGAYSDATGTSEATVTSAFVGGGLSDGLEATTYSRTTKLHCIAFRKLTPTYPLLSPPTPITVGTSDKEQTAADKDAMTKVVEATAVSGLAHTLESTGFTAADIREKIVAYLASLVGEYLLLHVLSRVLFVRDLRCVGKMSCNITNFPETAVVSEAGKAALAEAVACAVSATASSPAATSSDASADVPTESTKPVLPLHSGLSAGANVLYDGLTRLIARVVPYPMLLCNLQGLSVFPVKDYTLEKLAAGVLQLPHGTYVIVDETVMSEGKVDARGVLNLHALRNVCVNGELMYDFQFYQMNMPVDLPVLIVSPAKSITPVDFVLPLSDAASAAVAATTTTASASTTSSVVGMSPTQFFDVARKYLASVKFLPHSLPDDVSELVQDDMVKLRAEAGIGADEMHTLLEIARLVSLSCGETELRWSHWETAKRLEATRKARLPAPAPMPDFDAPEVIPQSPAAVSTLK